MSLPVRAVLGATSANAMQLSAQLVSALAAVLLTSSAHADSSDAFDTGASFFKACRSDNLDQKAMCVSKASGYADMLQALNMICLNGANRKRRKMRTPATAIARVKR